MGFLYARILKMKKYLIAILFILLTLSACSGFELDLGSDENFPEHNQSTNEEDALAPAPDPTEEIQEETQEEIIQDADCYEDGIHPAAQSIVDEYKGIIEYDEVMIWYCNGAAFEDIMNALLTEEMVEADPEELLRRIADGETWNDIWLTLGIIED